MNDKEKIFEAISLMLLLAALIIGCGQPPAPDITINNSAGNSSAQSDNTQDNSTDNTTAPAATEGGAQ